MDKPDSTTIFDQKGSDQRSASHYRPDIDGLRAVAVLSIFAFHLGLGIFPGGFVGVDIFFVLSGYLVGGQVLAKVRNKTFSITNFYVARLRRIIPALAFFLIIATIVALVVLLPRDLVDYSNSLVAAALFVSNHYFLATSGYFETASELKPLLHLWSLAVEEQFYLMLPLLLYALRAITARTVVVAICAIGFASLVCGQYLLASHPDATFYILPTRFWEFVVGIAAVEFAIPAAKSRWVREALSACGAMLVAGSILAYNSKMPFPAASALVPCVGTAFILAAGNGAQTFVSRVLAIRPLVAIGLVSYSLYLWHWLVIVTFKQHALVSELDNISRIAIVVFAFTMAYISWRFIERPWRDPSVSGRTIFAETTTVGVLALITGLVLGAANGLPARFNSDSVRLARYADDYGTNDMRRGKCYLSSNTSPTFDRLTCLSTTDRKANVLLLGDSHGAHLWSGLQSEFPTINFLQATASGCKPVAVEKAAGEARCTALMRYIFDDYLLRTKVDGVVLAARWKNSDATNVAYTLERLRKLKIPVVLSGPIVEYKASLPRILALAVQRKDPAIIKQGRQAGIAKLDKQYAALAAANNVPYMSPYRTLCPDGRCRVVNAEGTPLQFDYGHLTREGSRVVARGFPLTYVTDAKN
ncbi:acyltransferase family protein [Sphingomonas sp. CFBP 13720]|uniref:acyltransferase family protein n=1 Tax=Sphingomonas sp. CFBP 13720 TaxID=2775302 RepID=UPI00178527E8|nr:acyltransferase family protein [Sphingomonas sp. CFBP 13720]MBD8679672.1 acyltransferase [Sphingomonas sp. CFBP 13720]